MRVPAGHAGRKEGFSGRLLNAREGRESALRGTDIRDRAPCSPPTLREVPRSGRARKAAARPPLPWVRQGRAEYKAMGLAFCPIQAPLAPSPRSLADGASGRKPAHFFS